MAKLLDSLDLVFADCLLPSWEQVRNGYEIRAPWVADGWAYATNGRILVRQRNKRKDTKGRFPRCVELFEDWTPKAGVIIALPRSGRKRGDRVRCPDCRGRGCGCGVKDCVDGKVPRKTRPIDLGCGEYGLADRYAWLLRDHDVKIVQPIQDQKCFAFTKGEIEGRVNGQMLI